MREGGELFAVVGGGVVHEADVDAGGADRGEALELFGDALGLGERVERVFVLQHDRRRIRSDAPGLGVRARASIASISAVRSPNGAQPSPSSTARRSERNVRPPTHIGTCACTAHGSTRNPAKS